MVSGLGDGGGGQSETPRGLFRGTRWVTKEGPGGDAFSKSWWVAKCVFMRDSIGIRR